MKVNYVEYVLVGSFFSESSIVKIEHRDAKYVNIPKNSFGFRFCDREEQIVEGETLKGVMKNYSNWFYIGEKLSLKDVETYYFEKTTLISNMKNNGYKFVLKNKFGQFIPMNKDDVVI